MTYEQALEEGKRLGASWCGYEACLAGLCKSLTILHPGTNPELVFNGAIKKGLTNKELATLSLDDPVGYGDLMFVGMENEDGS